MEQNRFLSFTGFTLSCIPLHTTCFTDFSPRFVERYLYTLWNTLYKWTLQDAPRLLERLSIRVPNNTRLREIVYLPLGQTNFFRNAPSTSMMRDSNMPTLVADHKCFLVVFMSSFLNRYLYNIYIKSRL